MEQTAQYSHVQKEGSEGLGRPEWGPGHTGDTRPDCPGDNTDHRLSIFILPKAQAMQNRAGEPCQSVGEPLPNGTSIDVFHTAGIHNYIDTLPVKKAKFRWHPNSRHQPQHTNPALGDRPCPLQTLPHIPGRIRPPWPHGWHKRISGHQAHPHQPAMYPAKRGGGMLRTGEQKTTAHRPNSLKAQQPMGPGCLPKN